MSRISYYCILLYLMIHTFLCSLPSLIKYLEDHPHLFAVDPLLVHFVVHASPLEMYGKLVTKAPLFILLAALTERFSKSGRDKVQLNYCIYLNQTCAVPDFL